MSGAVLFHNFFLVCLDAQLLKIAKFFIICMKLIALYVTFLE